MLTARLMVREFDKCVCLASVAAALLFFPARANADVMHTVSRGHTLEAIAARYRVSVRALMDANHISDGRKLRPGDTLRIPGVKEPAKMKPGVDKGVKGSKADTKAKSISYAMKSPSPGIVQAVRLASGEAYRLEVNSKRGKVQPDVLKQASRLFRSSTNATHPVEPRLLRLLQAVSSHFGGRPIQVVSGFRPYSPKQHTAHSNHNVGRAVDFRVVGVPNEVVRDYCRTFKNVGVGYYPNSTFVHMDARAGAAFWIDYSKPGEAPRYHEANVAADEATSDVVLEIHGPELSAAPSEVLDPERPVEWAGGESGASETAAPTHTTEDGITLPRVGGPARSTGLAPSPADSERAD